jgi:hypothetical protein
MWESGSMPAGEAAILGAMVAAILPAEADLDAARRAAIEREVTGYVAAQIRSMPGFLRLPYRLALRLFDLLPLARFGRPFRALARHEQASSLARWGDARLPPMRDFVKLIRSTALLAYFDHPAVRELLDGEGSRAVVRASCQAANE